MKPMLAKPGNEEYLGMSGYIFEPKLDGFRAILKIGGSASITSRNGLDLSGYLQINKLPEINAISATLDGELVAYDENGNPEFNLLGQKNATFVAFDIIEKDGIDLKKFGLLQRKSILKETVPEDNALQLMFYTKDGRMLWKSMKERGIEGVIAKRIKSIYKEGTRSDDWVKIKFVNTVDCVIMGFTREKRKISSLALGMFNRDNLQYIGNVGTGFDEKFINDFYPKLASIIVRNQPGFPNGIIAVKPVYVAEVNYLKFTPGMKLRSPVFKRLRLDKDASECILPRTKKNP